MGHDQFGRRCILLREDRQASNLLPRLAECFLDGRNQAMINQLHFGNALTEDLRLALGYEDINDTNKLRTDPVFGIRRRDRRWMSRWPARAR